MIEHYSFGHFVIDGKEYDTDIKIINGKIIPHELAERHVISKVDIKDLLKAKPDVLIIGTGAYGGAHVEDEVKNLKNVIIKKTADACDSYNKALKEKKKVCAFLHSTC